MKYYSCGSDKYTEIKMCDLELFYICMYVCMYVYVYVYMQIIGYLIVLYTIG